MSFPDIGALERTDKTFRDRDNPEHHKITSLMEELPIDMISAFPTSDPLHLLELGVMKKLLVRWTYGEKGYKRKWQQRQKDRISRLLTNLNVQMPSDIHRAVRTLDSLKYWKGTEFRTMLLYVGFIVLKEVLPDDEYNHFLTLSCAARICYAKVYKKYVPIAKTLFESFVENYMELFGRDSIGSNVHNLIHICEDIKSVDSLIDISTYRFENSLRMMGLNLNNCNLPLEQIVRRLSESSIVDNPYNFDEPEIKPSVKYEFEPGKYKTISIQPDVTLSCRKSGDSWLLTNSHHVVNLKYIVKTGNRIEICGKRIKNQCDVFTKPLKSSYLHIFSSDGHLDDDLTNYHVREIKAKMMCLNYKDTFLFIPILHSIDSLN